MVQTSLPPEEACSMITAAISEQLAGGAHQISTAEFGTGRSAHPALSEASQQPTAGVITRLEAWADRSAQERHRCMPPAPGEPRHQHHQWKQKANHKQSIWSAWEFPVQTWHGQASSIGPTQEVPGIAVDGELGPGGGPRRVQAVLDPLRQRGQGNA
jgi:hypothetical protein